MSDRLLLLPGEFGTDVLRETSAGLKKVAWFSIGRDAEAFVRACEGGYVEGF